jgi:hypothetical protein
MPKSSKSYIAAASWSHSFGSIWDASPESAERAIDLSESQTAKQVHTTVVNELLRGAAEGRALADAMISLANVPHPRGRSVLISNLRAQRARSEPDVAKVFWGPQSGLAKPALADALWPVLHAKISKAIRDGKKGPPVMRACVRAYEMAVVSYGLKIMLRRRKWRPRK